MARRLWAGVLLAAAWAGTAWAQAPEGSEFRVNSYTTGTQLAAAVASDGSGNFVVVWTSVGQDGDSYGVRGRRYDASAVPRDNGLGSINSYATNAQVLPSVASDANGNFIVAWQSYTQDGSGWGVFAQRYDFSGTRQGAEFKVNTYTTMGQDKPAVAAAADGSFVIVWAGFGQDGSSSTILGQRYDASGVPLGAEFVINTYSTSIQTSPAVAADPGGDFVVVWQSLGEDGDGDGIFGQRFNAVGAPVGSEFQVNTYTTLGQTAAAVSMDASGKVVVVWLGPDASSTGVVGRRFDAAGTPQGGEFQVNSTTTGAQLAPKVSADAAGNFVVVWQSDDGDGPGVFGQRYDSYGIRSGSEFRVNSYVTSGQGAPAVALDPDGDFVVVWQSVNQDGSGYGIFGQRYGDLLFEDGFESGDLTRWSSAVTDGTDLRVAVNAAQAGTAHGIAVAVDDTNPLYVEDDTPSGESRYRARLYFDPHGFDPGEAAGHQRVRVLLAQADAGTRSVAIVLRRLGGAYSLQARVRLDDGSRADTGFFPITDAPHFCEFDWRRATSPGATDGSFTLRIDDAVVSTLTGLQNQANAVDYVRLGAMSVKTGATGTLRFDQFESRRRTLIGPE